MKRIVAYIMLLSLVTHLFYSSGYLLDYYVNTDFYKTNCTNKDKPQLHCDGKCILAQKIADAQQKQLPDESKMTLPMSVEYLAAAFVLITTENFATTEPPFTGWSSGYHYKSIYSKFQPPEFIS